MEQDQYISIFNKINNKPLIMEKIFPFILNRPCILVQIISRDVFLKNKLNQIFSKVKKKKNLLDKEFLNNLELYSLLREMTKKLKEWYEEVKDKHLTKNFLKNEINYSFLKYLVGKLKIYRYSNSILISSFDDINVLIGVVKEYYSSLDNAVIIYFSNNNLIDDEYMHYISDVNEKSKEKNKIKQIIKLLLIIDENEFSKINNNINLIRYPYINELELIFEDNISLDNLFLYFNSYLSKIEYLENINRIIFHNKISNNYLTDNNVKINNEFYQSLSSFLFDNYYSVENLDIKFQIKLLINLKDINIENITYIYIYEKMKLYYCINDIFPLLQSKKNVENKKILDANIPFYLNNKIMIINNKEKELKNNELISFIKNKIKNNKNFEYLMIVNHKKLINENIKDNIKENNDENKVDISYLKEFIYISEESEFDNNKELIDILILNNKYYIYKGYDKNNKLIIYRQGETQIQSFDLIDLFKYNKKLTQVKLINEKIMINFNEERTKLEIINIGQEKSEISKIINAKNILNINHFSQFIFNQKSLKELTISKFDISLNYIINKNIDTLNLNYFKEKSILKYYIENNNINETFEDLFPNLINLNVGGNCKDVCKLLNKSLTNKLKQVNIIKINKSKILSKVLKKIRSYKININIYDLNELFEDDKNNNNDYEDEFDDYEGQDEYEEEEEIEI